MSAPVDWTRYRQEVPAAASCIYLNAGWSGPLPETVAAAMRAWLEEELRLGPTRRELMERGREAKARYRELFAGLLGALPEEIAVMENTTEGINVVVNGLGLQAGDVIVTTNIEHPSGLVPAYVQRERRGCEVRIVDLEGVESAAEALERFDRALDGRVKLVLLSEVSYLTGLWLPLGEIVERAHAVGARVLVDGAQSAGHIPLDVRATNVDFYALTAHKWLCGPDGIGALYIRQDLIPEVEPVKVAGRAARRWDTRGTFEPERELITKFELTTVSPLLVAGANAALERYLTVGADAILARIRELHDRARALLAAIPSVSILTPSAAELRAGLLSFRIGSLPFGSARVASGVLQSRRGIVCRSLPGLDGIRFSIHAYNTEEELERAAEAVEELARGGLPEGAVAEFGE